MWVGAGLFFPEGFGEEHHDGEYFEAADEHEEGEEGDQRKGDVRGEGGAPYRHPEGAEEEGVEPDDQERHEDVERHAVAEMPADPQIVVHREGEGGDGKEKRVGPHVGGRLLEELSFRAHRMEDGPSGEESDRRDDGLDEEDEEDRAREKGARLLFLPLAEADGDDDARAHPDEVGEGIGNNDEGEGEVRRVICGLAEEEREEESVEDGVSPELFM